MQPFKKGDVPRDIGRTKGGLNSKLHAVCDGFGKPVLMCLTAGQVSDYKGARKLLNDFPAAKHLLAPSHGLFHKPLSGNGSGL